MQSLPFIMAGVSAVSSISAGHAQAEQLKFQAEMAKITAKSEALQHERQGIDVLNSVLRQESALIARAAAGGVNPNSGSAAMLRQRIHTEGEREYATSQRNIRISLGLGRSRSGAHRQGAKAAMTAGLLGAVTGGAEGYRVGKWISTPSKGLT